MFLDEIDKMDPSKIKKLLLILQWLIGDGRILLYIAGNIGTTTTALARESQVSLTAIRMHPIYHPSHIRQMASAIGIFRGQQITGYFPTPRPSLHLGPHAWAVFTAAAGECGGVPALLSSLIRGTMREAEKIHRVHGQIAKLDLSAVITASQDFSFVPLSFGERYMPTPVIAEVALAALPLRLDDVIRPAFLKIPSKFKEALGSSPTV
eukprot:gnl/Dysnectes_brevis/15168_a36571_63.p1 GENE.gnl/Dysnectes_brevis/15168_a36571_63~~gnl/Dysnectes_brevis/15168_a36571_63.p1  ORF type:complete len:208 (-),score=46.58 gnl/Dysnectes_brevis/15168_a36571_63:200-823(-)